MDWAYFKLTYMHKMITVDAGEGKYELIVLVSRYALCELETRSYIVGGGLLTHTKPGIGRSIIPKAAVGGD